MSKRKYDSYELYLKIKKLKEAKQHLVTGMLLISYIGPDIEEIIGGREIAKRLAHLYGDGK